LFLEHDRQKKKTQNQTPQYITVNPEPADTIRTVCLLHDIIIDTEGVNETVAMT
jgi:hypothetical protein